jgi:hypothetical protein
MAAPDPESFGLLGKLVTAGGVVAAPVIWLWTKLDKKVDKHTLNNDLQRIEGEQGLHRQYFAKVFEKMDEHSRRDEELFREVMTKMGNNHAEVLTALGRKADR